MFFELFLFETQMILLTKGWVHCIARFSFGTYSGVYFLRGHSLVGLMEHGDSVANIIVHRMYTYIYCCIHSTLCVPIVNKHRRGTRKEPRKQTLDSA